MAVSLLRRLHKLTPLFLLLFACYKYRFTRKFTQELTQILDFLLSLQSKFFVTEHSNIMRSTTFFALLGGLAAGAVLGMLYAPDKGSVTRKKCKQFIEEEFEDLKDLAEDGIENVKDKARDYKDKAKAAVQKKTKEHTVAF